MLYCQNASSKPFIPSTQLSFMSQDHLSCSDTALLNTHPFLSLQSMFQMQLMTLQHKNPTAFFKSLTKATQLVHIGKFYHKTLLQHKHTLP